MKALSGLTPVELGNALRFSEKKPLEMIDQNPEEVAKGFYEGQQQMVSGITEGIMSALNNLFGAYQSKQLKKQATEEKSAADLADFEKQKVLAQILAGGK
jgi:hypothetical protein